MASGNSMGYFLPSNGEPPSSLFALPNIRNGILVAEFDPTTEWSLIFRGVLPRSYSGGGLTVTVHWMASSATSNVTVWGGSFERDNANNHDLDSDAFATEQTANGTANGTSGKITSTAITFADGATAMDSLAGGDPYRFKLARKAADGSDTMAGAAQLVAIEIKET